MTFESALISALGTIAHSGTAQGGSSTSLTLASTAAPYDDAYAGQTLTLGDGRSRTVSDYDGATRGATVAAWSALYASFPGTSANYISTPDVAAIRITGNISLRAEIAANDYTAAGDQGIVSRNDISTTPIAYRLVITTTGALKLGLSQAGFILETATSSATLGSVGVTDGSRVSVRADWRQSDGRVQFFYSTDQGDNWTQLGTDQAIAIASIFGSAGAALRVGCVSATQAAFSGKIYWVEVYNDTTLAADFNSQDALPGAQSVVSSATGETWTLNASGSPTELVLVGPDPDSTTTYTTTENAIAGGRVYPLVLPQTPTYPAVTFQRLTGIPQTDLDGLDGNLLNIRLQLDCWVKKSQTFGAVRNLAEAVRWRLRTVTDNFRAVTNFDQDLYEDETALYRTLIDASFWYRTS